MNHLVGAVDVCFLCFDSLRFDVAERCHSEGLTPNLSALLPGGWEKRDTPGNFTFPAHQAFFHGFLPTIHLGTNKRLFALEFLGSETTNENTCIFTAQNIIKGFRQRGYRTICIGGVGFFNKLNPLGNILPGFFQESYWDERLSVTCRHSTGHQVTQAIELLDGQPATQLVFLYINISATHHPHHIYLPNGDGSDTPESQMEALCYADGELGRLFRYMASRGRCFYILLSDHGDAYGEDGCYGHRINHPAVIAVPYAHILK